jgi:hypothetical protein
MKRILSVISIACVACVVLSNLAIAAPIQGLFNTGVDDLGVVLPINSVDPHYSLTGPSSISTAYVLARNPSWFTPPAGSAWIEPTGGNANAPLGEYTYTLTFNLTGLNASTATISGAWSTDNTGVILLNGSTTGISNPSALSFSSLNNFQINSGFVSGTNTLEFIVTNTPNTGHQNPTGLLVTNLEGVASAVPIPSAFWLLGSGLLGMLGIGVRRKTS